MKKNKSPFLFLIFAVFLWAFNLSPLRAESYDIYVDKGANSGGDGTEAKPFNDISKAVSKAGSKSKNERKIFVKKGTYSESITLPDSAKLYGDGTETIIKGMITMGDGSLVQNLTVSSPSSNGFYIPSGKDAEIVNCRIKYNLGIGIKSEGGGGSLKISNSKISNNKNKGVYVESGKNLEVSGNEVYENSQEGLDLRSNMSGSIKNNNIYDNGEGGIESVIGKSDLLISGNKINSNSASGIALQFYSSDKKLGGMKIRSNSIQKNGKFGLDCNAPSGGNVPTDYWKDSILIEGNTLVNNKEGAISSRCKLMEELEKKKLAEDQKEKVLTLAEKKKQAEEEKKRQGEMARQEAERKAEEERLEMENKDMAEKTRKEIEVADVLVKSEIAKTGSRGKIKTFFLGPDRQVIKEAEQRLAEKQEAINTLAAIRQNLKKEENILPVDAALSGYREDVQKQKNLLDSQKNKFSLFGWLF